MNLATIASRYGSELPVDEFAEIDGSPNGIQVGVRDHPVECVAGAVDAAQATISAAAARDADLLVTHHGLWWEGTERLTDATYRRVATLIDNDIALYVAHLPLDSHPSLGNAAGVAELMGLTNIEPFGSYHGETVGVRGQLPAVTSVDAVADTLATELSGIDGSIRQLQFGADQVQDVAVITGKGLDWHEEASEAGVDLLVSGEGDQSDYHPLREAGLNVILAGHYATETAGVRNLLALADSWGLATTFIEEPTGF